MLPVEGGAERRKGKMADDWEEIGKKAEEIKKKHNL